MFLTTKITLKILRFEVNVGDKIDGSVDITKIDNSLDYSKKNIIGSINWSIQPKIKTAFAVLSDDDGSLNFYKRSSVPKAGEQFEGKTATEVYTGIETDKYNYSSDVPWYSKRSSITNIQSVDTIKPVSITYWFYNCTALTSLDLSNFDTSAVTSMGFMFDGCSSLTSLDLSNFNTSAVTYMNSMFEGCTGLTSLDLSNFNTSKVTDMRYMFHGCSSLTTLDLSSFDTSVVTKMSQMFYNCSKLQQVKLGNKFAWKSTDGFLPTPYSSYIPGADGKWYAVSDGTGYAPRNIPSNKADTYYASKDLLPKMTGNIQISGSNFPGSTLSAIVEGVPSNTNIGYQWYIGVGSKGFEYVVTDIFVDDGIRHKVGEATLSDKDVILFKGEETNSYSIDAEIINSSGAVVFKKTFNENQNSAYFKPSESGVYKVKVRLTSGSTYFEATKRALELSLIHI